MKRVGNRFALAVKRWKRACRLIELLRFRQRWAQKFDEYECVGGPLDGITRPCQRASVLPTLGGYYEIDGSDCRLHFHTRARSSSWSGGV